MDNTLEPPPEGKRKATVGKVLLKPLQNLRRHSLKAVSEMKAMQTVPKKQDVLINRAYGKEKVNRIQPGMCPIKSTSVLVEIVVSLLDGAINCHQSEYIAEARERLKNVSKIISKADAGCFEFPTGYGRQVLERGKELFLKDGVSCSLKHGTLILDSSNSGAKFYVGLLNVVGAFAVTISEYELGAKIFSLLISFHRDTNVTTHLRDLGAAYNNAGCISLIKGDLRQAEVNFKFSLKNLKSAERVQLTRRNNSADEKVQRPNNTLLDVMLIAVESNFSRLYLMSRDFGEAVVKQEQVVKRCKAKKSELPYEAVFTALNNQAVLHTTLTNFEKAEEALEWLKWYCMEMKREDCDFLLNFTSLHLCEVLLLSGKSKAAEREFRLEKLTSAHGTELSLMFGGLHINVRTEAFEKLVDVLVLRGKVEFACDLLEKGLSILQKSFGHDHFNVASLLYKQGTILSLLGEFSNSYEKFKRPITTLKEMFGETHPLLLKFYISLGDVLLTLKRKDESFLYFQRAMENIEELYQVSFVSQLSKMYSKMTKEIKHSQDCRMREDKTESLVEDLVAEYGLSFAVLLSRMIVQGNNGFSGRLRSKGKRPLTAKSSSVQSSRIIAIISLKCTRDLLQSGQSFLRQGMIKEAAAFFHRASKYCVGQQMVKGPSHQCLARLYGILAKNSLESRKPLEDYDDLIDCLKELSEVSTMVSTDSDPKGVTAAPDCQLTLKLVLIFLIRLSIELKVIHVTFEAYDLYAKLSYSDAGFMFFHNGGVQFYASRTSITCNGKTAVQDILISSTIGLSGNDSECPPLDKQLFRNLACKKNVPTDTFLVTYHSSILLDIDKLQKLEEKISLSVQECFQRRCFETGINDNSTQVLVDLSSKSTCNIVAVGRRIELLSLCLSEEMNADVTHEGQVSKIFTAVQQKTRRVTFEDEQTSRFMFSKNVLSLLQQCNAGNFSAVSVEHQCLTLTIVHPVKARLTLRRNSRCIAQKLQFIQTSTMHGLTDGELSQLKFNEVPEENYCATDCFLCQVIDNLANKYHVACETDVSYTDLPSDDSDACNQQNRNPLDAQQSQETYSQILSQEYEQNETLRICLNASVLEGLSAVSEISRQLYEDWTPEYGNIIEVIPGSAATSGFTSFSESHLQKENISSSSQEAAFDPEDDLETHSLTWEAPHSASVEHDPWVPEDNSMSRTEDDDNALGRSLFEKDRRLRRSFTAELHENLKRKSTQRELNIVNPEEVIQNVIDVASSIKKDTASHVVTSDESSNNPTYIDVTSSSIAQLAYSSEDELKPQRLISGPSLYDEKSTAADNENALGAHIFGKDKKSTSASTAMLKESNMETTAQELNILGDGNSTTGNITSGKQKCIEDRYTDATRERESSPVLGGSGLVAEEEDKQRAIETTKTNLIAKVEVEDAGFLTLCQSETCSYIQDQTEHRHQNTLHEVHRPTTHSPTYVEKGRECSQSEAVIDHSAPKRYEQEKKESKVQNEPLRQKEIPKPVSYVKMTKKITPGSRFEFDEDVVTDGPSSSTPRRTRSNANDLMPSTNTHVVNKPLERVGKNIQTESGIVFNKEVGMWTLGKSNVDDNYNEAFQSDTRSTERSQFHHGALKKTTFRHPYRGCRGGDVFVDGDSRDASLEEDEVVDGPAFTSFESFPNVGGVGIHRGEAFKSYQNGSKKVSGKKFSSCQSDAARDVVDAPVYSSKIDTMVKDIPSDFGGARPKERSTNVIKSISTTKPGMTKSSLACQYEETATPGINPHFQARHTLKSNGALLETPWQDHYDDPYFSAKAMACNENVREPWVRFNQPGYASKSSRLGLYVEEDYGNRPSTRGDGQSLASYQKLPLWRNESWHFPPLEIAETTATQGNVLVDRGYGTQQHSIPLEDSILSEVKAPFNSRESRNAYNEMDSITNEYHNSTGDLDRQPLKSPIGIARQQSSTKDPTSSLLGSLQQVMEKTVKLITSGNAVGRQLRQEPREVEKRGIQEETRKHREQEEPLTPRVEDSTNQLESSQENEQALDTERQSIGTPVQETPRPVCSHYQRRCLVRFPCCGKFYPCHRCHNESEDCSDDQARAINATHIRCTICYHEQPIDEQSQNCGECKSKMSEYFCPTCKHFTSVDKNPFHCDKCGICRIHRDRSFHCDVCNVCLDKRLQGKHKCRPDSGHDECCICLEDAFSGCQILPCSHKVHKDCAIAMIQNGVRTCPICRHPLFSQPQNSSQ